jgi:hypothetical protein
MYFGKFNIKKSNSLLLFNASRTLFQTPFLKTIKKKNQNLLFLAIVFLINHNQKKELLIFF